MKKSIYLVVLLLFAMPAMAQNTETELFYPAEYAIIDVGMLTAVGRQVYQNGVRLTPDEVRGLMAGTNALAMYNAGLRRNRNGNIILLSGVGAVATGFAVGFLLPHDYVLGFHPAVITTALGIGVAQYTTITGLVLKGTSRGIVRNAVDMHNQNAHTSSVEFNFGFTQNGIGMVVRF